MPIVYSDLSVEFTLWQQGFKLVCGVDEVGRGCFAGPVVAGAVLVSDECELPDGIADSKLLKPQVRKELVGRIKEAALAWAIGEVSVEDINQYGIGKATQMAFVKAIKSLTHQPDQILIDAFFIEGLSKDFQHPIVRGDKMCSSIAAASIIAKVYRDELMEQLDNQYPGYDFAIHKGYGTKAHQNAIKLKGLSPLHRTSFNLQKFL
jgi:ribonuclease HII